MSDHYSSAMKNALSLAEKPSWDPFGGPQKMMAAVQRRILDMQGIQGPRFISVLGTAASKLELGEGLLGAGRFGHLQGVVLHGLAQGPVM